MFQNWSCDQLIIVLKHVFWLEAGGGGAKTPKPQHL